MNAPFYPPSLSAAATLVATGIQHKHGAESYNYLLGPALEFCGNAIAFFNAANANVFCNKKAEALVWRVWNRAINQGDHLFDFLPVRLHSVVKSFLSAPRNSHALAMEKLLPLQNDTYAWYHLQFLQVFDADEVYKGCIVSVHDITTQKHAEWQLRNQSRRLRAQNAEITNITDQLDAIINSSYDSIIFANPQNKLIFYNKASVNHFLKKSNKLLEKGESLLDYMPPEKRTVFKALTERIPEEKLVETEEEIVYPDGDRAWFFRKFYGIYNKKGDYAGYVLNSTNITRRKIFELTLSDQNRRLKEIARIQSHELRRPLANILGLVYLLAEKDISEEDRSLFLSKLNISAQELDGIIKEIVENTISANK